MIDALELGLAESFSGAQTMDLITDRRALHRNVNELPGEIVLSRLETLIHNADANRKSGNFMI